MEPLNRFELNWFAWHFLASPFCLCWIETFVTLAKMTTRAERAMINDVELISAMIALKRVVDFFWSFFLFWPVSLQFNRNVPKTIVWPSAALDSCQKRRIRIPIGINQCWIIKKSFRMSARRMLAASHMMPPFEWTKYYRSSMYEKSANWPNCVFCLIFVGKC